MLVLTCLELQAQQTNPTVAPTRRLPRYGLTNGVPGTFPRYQPAVPAAQGTSLTPRNQTGVPGAGAIPGGPGSGNIPAGFPNSGYSSAAASASAPEEMIEPGLIKFEGVDIGEVLKIYAKLVNRTLLRGALPQAQIVLDTQTPLTKTEAIQALQAVLALNGVSLVNIGDKFVKVLPSDQAAGAGEEIDRTGSTNIPALGSYITHVVQLKYVKPTEMAPVIQPFSKLNSIIPLDANGILVIRDYAENVKRMLEMIEMVDVSVPAEYISEVIPIRYAKVDDIASALNALGGGGGATVSIGTAPSSGQISGFGSRGMSGMSGMGSMGNGLGSSGSGAYGSNPYQSGGLGSSGSTFGGNRTTPNGTPSSGSTFQQRLSSIINGSSGGGSGGAGGKDQIQLFGNTKIIPNESSSTLLIYATHADMEVIKGIIAKLDVPLAQVLIEAVIMDVTLGHTFNFGVSAAQNPVSNGNFIGGGGVNNSSSGSPFIDFVKTVTQNSTNGLVNGVTTTIGTLGSSGTNSGFANNLPGGVSYFANIGPNWDVAVNAAESDNHADIIQRPRIQTSQAKPAQFFVGNTVPYVTGTYNGYSGYGGNSYSQLSVGVELDVTPFINPEGLVVMDIQQEIDDLNGYTAIENVGNVPNTIKRTLNTEIAVRDKDTVMLGGFIKTDKSHTQSGVPFLSDIPILGNLFKQRSDSKDREELIVLMRPTVLDTPELAAKQTAIEEQRLPGVEQAAAEDGAYERTLIEAQKKRAAKEFKKSGNYEGFFAPPDTDTNVLQGVPGPVSSTNNVPVTVPAKPGANDEDPNAAPPQADNTLPQGGNNGTASLDPATRQQMAAAALAEYNRTNGSR